MFILEKTKRPQIDDWSFNSKEIEKSKLKPRQAREMKSYSKDQSNWEQKDNREIYETKIWFFQKKKKIDKLHPDWSRKKELDKT